jgi:tetratricopeptide (TPR) repeat protein
MLGTIREYAFEKLEECGEAGVVRQRHAVFYLALVEEAEVALRGAGLTEWLEKLDAEHDNIRAALGWALETGEAEIAIRMSSALWHFWQIRSYFSEGRMWLEQAVELAGRTRADAEELRPYMAKALLGGGLLTWHQYDFAAAQTKAELSVATWKEVGDNAWLGLAMVFLGQIAEYRGDTATWRSLSRQGLAVLRETDDNWQKATGLVSTGVGAAYEGDYSLVRPTLEEALQIGREIDDRWTIAQSLNILGDIARVEGDYAGAEPFYRESLQVYRELRVRADIPAALHNLGHVALGMGDADQARGHFQEALELQRELGNKHGMAECLVGLACVAAAQGDARRAVRIFAAADALLKAASTALWAADRVAYDHYLAAARAALTEDEFAQAWDEGFRLGHPE